MTKIKTKIISIPCLQTLVGNWYEDRRAYKQICCRCTGHSITQTDFLAPCKEDLERPNPLPSKTFGEKFRQGVGHNFLWNTEDYCDYLQNYTTTYDLMHNWEVRRAGCKPKAPRRWKMIRDASWVPENDNAVSFVRLAMHFRKAKKELLSKILTPRPFSSFTG
jgi:hypothetical protein